MKIKRSLLLFVLALCFCLSACGEAKRPIDYPNTTWTCENYNVKFSVSEEYKIKEAVIIDKDGRTVNVAFVFSDIQESRVSITNPEGSETYLSGECIYDKDSFKIEVTDIYVDIFSSTPIIMTFERT